jgi:feruloyl esterase
MAAVYNADAPDLSAFIGAGGKMIVWHGWADAIVTPLKTVEWYEEAAAAAGGEEALAEHVRLFMIPGLDHCGIQPGPGGMDQSRLDLLTRLERWVEEGTAPETVMAEQ